MLKNKNHKTLPKKKILIGAVIAIIAVIVAVIAIMMANKEEKTKKLKRVSDPELARAMTYDQFVDGDENVEGTDNVKFSAFFLRDVNNDGDAEKIKGTCKKIGKEDTLYMEVNVQTEGILKNGKIEIDGKNFYLKTASPKDDQFKENYISDNTKVMELHDIDSGTQKLFSGIIRSGNYNYSSTKAEAIGNNINNLSRKDNKIIFTGTYVNNNNEEIEIRKEITLETDWYGTAYASLYRTSYDKKDLRDYKDNSTGTVTLDLDFTANETNKELSIQKNYVEGTIPQLNGYDPITVTCENNVSFFNYDEKNKMFIIRREAILDENTGKITSTVSSSCEYTIKVKYPIEAINEAELSTSISVKIMTYFIGYNNQNDEFENPYKSNEATKEITWDFRNKATDAEGIDAGIRIGKFVPYPERRYVVSKLKPLRIYNGISYIENDDTYDVYWTFQNGNKENKVVFSSLDENMNRKADIFYTTTRDEISMEPYSSIVGINFKNSSEAIKADGWIKVYDDETDDLLVEFTKSDLAKYENEKIYEFENPVKFIRIETSEVISQKSIAIHLSKKIDDEELTANFSKDEFGKLAKIKSYMYIKRDDTAKGCFTCLASYEEEYSDASLLIKKSTLSTQVTEKNDQLTIHANADENSNQIAWKNGVFLIKMPPNIIATEINKINITNADVEIVSYEYIENENGKFIKVNTNNRYDELNTYDIILDVNLTPDPRIASKTEYFELYAYNEATASYYYSAKDIYDLNNNLNTEELVHKSEAPIYMVSPNSLLTNQILTDYDESGSVIISPQIADIKRNIVSADGKAEEKTVKIGVQLKNNYSNNLSDVKILGKIPFEGNTYVLSEGKLNSQFTTKMKNTGIEIPEQLKGKVTVYYSENENPDRNIAKVENNWKTKEQVDNWDNIKTYLIDFQNELIKIKDEYTFYYSVVIPNNVEYNKVAYSHHGIWFTLETQDGKYRAKTEPNKIGIRIAKKYDLEIQKYQTGKDILVPGATYKVTKEATDLEKEQTQTAVTNNEGKIVLQNLYAESVYTVQEIKSPAEFELNDNIIKFIAHVEEDGSISIEKEEGTVKEDILTEAYELENGENLSKVIIKVEDEVKFRLKLSKYEKGTDIAVNGATYKITNSDHSIEKYIKTNENGTTNLVGLIIGEKYTLEEVKANGYYLNNLVTFSLNNNDGIYTINNISGDTEEINLTDENGIPSVNMKLMDKKIPTYTLEVEKIKKITTLPIGEEQQEKKVTLPGAKFKLYKGSKEVGTYTTNENGIITIEGLYQYDKNEVEDAEYTLKEVVAPEGYSKVKDIVFRVDRTEGELKFVSLDNKEYEYTSNNNIVKLVVQDTPSFKIIKKDAETGERIAGVKFSIYNVDSNMIPARNGKGEIIGTKETIDGKQYYVVETNSQGEILIDLPEGSYKAVEVQAPDKYDISDSEYYFGIGGSREGKKSYSVESVNTVGGSSTDEVTSIRYTLDGGYIAAGSFNSNRIELENGNVLVNQGSSDGMLIKYNSNHECSWAKTIGGSGSEVLKSVEQTSDGGYIVSGTFSSANIELENGDIINGTSGVSNCVILKYDKSGNIEWKKVMTGNKNSQINKVIEDSNGNYIAVGSFSSNNFKIDNDNTLENNYKNEWCAYIVKLNYLGKTEWAKAVGGNGNDYFTSMAITNDGEYIVSGIFESTNLNFENGIELVNAGSTDGVIIKYNSLGECQWVKSIGGTKEEYVTSVDIGRNNEILVAGYYNSVNVSLENDITITNMNYSSEDGFVIKYDENGNEIFADSIGGNGSDKINQIKATKDGGYFIIGNYTSSSITIGSFYMENYSNDDSFLIKYDKKGEMEYLKSIGGDGYDYIKSIDENENELCLIAGSSNSNEIKLGNNKRILNVGSYDGTILEFNKDEISNPVVTQIEGIAGRYGQQIYSMENTEDGGYIVGAALEGESIDLGNGIYYTSDYEWKSSAAIIKYNAENQCEWVKAIDPKYDSKILKVIQTNDDNYVAIGYYNYGGTDNDKEINLPGNYGSFVIKYDQTGNILWIKVVNGTEEDYKEEQLTAICEAKDGGYLVGGYFGSKNIILENGMKLENQGDINAMLIKYSESGNVEWAKVIGKKFENKITAIESREDGDFIIAGSYSSQKLELENGTYITNTSNLNTTLGEYYKDTFILKCSANGELNFLNNIGGIWTESINSIEETENGGYIVAGNFNSICVSLGNNVNLYRETRNGRWSGADTNGFIAEYDANGELLWYKKIGNEYSGKITDMKRCGDSGYILSGTFHGKTLKLGNSIKIMNNYSNRSYGAVIKIDAEGECTWAKVLAGDKDDTCDTITELNNGDIIAGGSFTSDSLKVDNKIIKKKEQGTYTTDGVILRISNQVGVPEAEELTIENNRKEFKITTDVQEIEGVKGGTISGEDSEFYEKVKYGDSTTKDIEMIPDENYEIIGITINDQDYPIEQTKQKSFTLPRLENLTEDKHIVVKYALSSNKITINKVDKNTNERLAGAEFTIEQIDTREQPTNVLGDLTDNGETTNKIDYDKEIVDKIGELTNNGAYYFVKTEDGTYVPTNSKNYQIRNGGTGGISDSVANSYIPIDLTNVNGIYQLVIEAKCTSESNYDYGYATITTTTDAPAYTSKNGRIIYESGDKYNIKEISTPLNGGNIYYLHLGYRKDGSGDSGDDQICFNSIKLYECTELKLHFNSVDGKHISSNEGLDNTTSNSYIPIDLTKYTGKYKLTVNATISSQARSDIGYATVTQTTTAPRYNNENGRFIYISGNIKGKNYSTILQGGNMYYLHLGYYKDELGSEGNDKFTVNSVNISLSNSELYHTTVTTNSFGQAITQIPFGKYNIKETKAPDGYLINSEPLEIEIQNTEDATHEFTIENEVKSEIIVHHYIKGTTTKVARDELLEGKEGENYTTAPKMDLSKYGLELDENGKYILPQNAYGKYEKGKIEVIYYYVEKEASVIVHHYYEGTQTKVVLKNGKEADDNIIYGEEGERYTTVALTDELEDNYTVVSVPENAEGTFSKNEIDVIYYYAKKKVPLKIEKVDDEGNSVSNATFKVYSKYENKLNSEEVINNGPKYEEMPDLESESVEFDQRLITANEFFEIIGTTSEEQYSNFINKNGVYESTYEYDDDGNLLGSLGMVELDLTGISGTYMLAINVEKNGGYVNMGIETAEGGREDIGELYGQSRKETFYEKIEGGKKYYLGVYYEYEDVTKNYCRINSIKMYNVKSKQYGFIQNEYGEYVSDNVGMQETIASSYMLLDLSGKSGTYELDVESTLNGHGEASINLYDEYENKTEIYNRDTRRYGHEEYSDDTYNYESGIHDISTKFLEGGHIYKLEFVYSQESIQPSILEYNLNDYGINLYSEGSKEIKDPAEELSDQFIINKVVLETHTNLIDKTDNLGNLTFMVEPGEYDILESNVPNGYEAPENAKQRIIVGENGVTITVVNRKHKGTVTVHHYIEGTKTSVPLKDGTKAEDEILRGDEGEEYLTKEINDDKSIYTVSEVPENASGKYIDGDIEVTYYYRLKDTSVITHYYEEGTTNKISEDKVINGRINDEYVTVIADDIPSKYELVATPANATGTMTEDTIEIIYYFRKKATQVIVRHYEEGTTVKLSEDITIDGRVDDPYTTEAATDVPIKYELSVTPANANGTMTENIIEVIYYYRVKDAVLNIRYLEKGTEKELAQPEQQHGKVDEEYITGAKTIDGYTLVEHSGNERGKFEVNPLTVTYYYLYNTRATVQYIDKITGQILEQSTTEGLEGDDFVTESKSFDNYILVEEPAQKTVKMTKEEQVLKYYYIHVSGGVIEKHIDMISGEILSNDTHQGNEGDTYNIPSRTFQGYDLVEDRLPANAQGTMTVNPIEVIYYYIYKSKVTAQYVDKNTGEKLTEDEVQNGHEKDAYITDRKTFDDYKLVEVPANADGEMTKKDITVTYNYVHTSGGVIVNHIDINTGKQLLDETKQEGYEGDPYETHEENIPGYTLVKEKYPANAQGIMAREETRVTYYYVKNTEVNIKYIDKETGEEITEKTNIPGKEGENYTTEPKDISGYDLVEEPTNKDGTMTAEPIDVIYYYRRPAKVVVKYIDQETNEEIATEEKQEGHQNDEYTTEAKDIKYYKLIATPDNATGTMKVTVTKDETGKDIVEDTTYVTYYYRKLIFNLNIDKKVSSVTVNGEESIINGDLGKVEVHRKELNTAKVEVKYIIKVTNNSELTGKASILEDIPTGMIMNAEKNAGWEVKGTTATRETKELNPGESEEYLVVLDWENGENNIGMKENTASIILTENEAGYDEKDTADNEDKADVIVAISTGGQTYIVVAGGILLVLIALGCGVYVGNKQSKIKD